MPADHDTRPLGRTGIHVMPLGIGTNKWRRADRGAVRRRTSVADRLKSSRVTQSVTPVGSRAPLVQCCLRSVATETCGQLKPLKFSRTVCVY